MRRTFSTLACPTWTLGQIISAAQAYGYAGIDFRGVGSEIDITRVGAFTHGLAQTLRGFAAAKVAVPCLCLSAKLVATPAQWADSLAEVHRYSQLARQTGCTMLRVFGGTIPAGTSRADATTVARRHLAQAASVAADAGAAVLLETHDDWATSAEILPVVDGIANTGVIWDVEHPFRKGEPPATTAARLGALIRHVHIKDSLRRDGRSTPTLLGAGELPLVDAMSALDSINYAGWLCLETEKRWNMATAPEPEQSLPQFAEWLASIGRGA